MAGRGQPPKIQRRNKSDKPQRGDWKPTMAQRWQHGEIPDPPDGLKVETIKAWRTWFGAWFASNWMPHDLPGLETTILLYDQVRRGEFQRATELRLSMDNYGITPKGQQDRRWAPPKDEEVTSSQPKRRRAVGERYARLQVLGDVEEQPA